MKKYIAWGILLLSFACLPHFSLAHSAAISTTKLIQKKDNTWEISVKAALTAQEYEVRQQYGMGAFKTPEEFKQLLLQYALSNLILKTIDGRFVYLKNGQVTLAHEGVVRFELEPVSGKIDTLVLSNRMFKHIHGHQGTLEVLANDSTRQRYILNSGNDFTQRFPFKIRPDLKQKKKPNEPLAKTNDTNYFLPMLVFFIGLLVIVGFALQGRKKKQV